MSEIFIGSGGGAGGSGGGGAAQGGYQYPPTKPKFSFNRFIVEPYISTREVKTASAGRTEFARIEQKISVKGLRLLVDVVMDGMQTKVALDRITSEWSSVIKAGSVIFIREELLHTQPWAKAIYESEYVGKFILVDKAHIEFIQPL